MKSKLYVIIIILPLIASACGPARSETQAASTSLPSVHQSPQPEAATPAEYPGAVQSTVMLLRQQLGLGIDEIRIISFEAVEWSDSCLGVQRADQMCAQVLTPGYKVILEARGGTYEYHTDLTGQGVRLVSAPPVASAEAALTWQSNGMPCETAVLSAASLTFGECGGGQIAVPEEMIAHGPRLAELTSLYASFTAETPAGSLIFKGSGDFVPTVSEQRAMAEWARLLFQIAQAGRTGAAWGLAFAWHREGGAGDFCDNVTVYMTGLVGASDCKGYNVQGHLTASRLDQVYGWVDRLGVTDHTETFPVSADGFTMTLTLAGNGGEAADQETIQEIFEFAATLFTELGYIAGAGAEVGQARDTLNDYLIALHEGDFARAASLYGGDTELLRTWNPEIGDDLPDLLRLACTQNGLQCLLPRTITYRAPDDDGGYHFYVEFNNEDRTLFQQGPCCGETDGVPVSLFPFHLEETPAGLLVTDLPPYVP